MARLLAAYCLLSVWLVAGAVPSTAPPPMAPEGLEGVVAPGASPEAAATGFQFAEGPIWGSDGLLYFTDVPRNRILRFGTDERTHVWRENTQGAAGLAFDRTGRLFAAQGLGKRIVIFELDGSITTLADQVGDRAFLRPNDLTIHANGGIYFTDPGRGGGADAGDKPSVFYLPPGGDVVRIADDLERPSGIILSPDERTLYAANSLGGEIIAFDLDASGAVRSRRVFARLRGAMKVAGREERGAGGMAVDRGGRLYAATPAGIQVFARAGEYLGTIQVPKRPSNLTFGGAEKDLLYITAGDTLYRVRMQVAGLPGRAK